MNDTVVRLTTTSIAQTIAFGQCIGALLIPTDLILLSGGLGAGKTHLSKGIVAGLGSLDIVTSPTYVFVNEYRLPARGVVFHVDLYRAEDPQELASIGLDDALAGHGACLIEWPERDPSLSALQHLAIAMSPIAPEQRLLTLSAKGKRAHTLLAAIQTTWQNGIAS
ncbi:MAG: hypothetical protein RLY87_1641 [Chloroflexota bacterium]|jgi:tRNA threonylcarbamoyladenosine biosynthesis protein TsaE